MNEIERIEQEHGSLLRAVRRSAEDFGSRYECVGLQIFRVLINRIIDEVADGSCSLSIVNHRGETISRRMHQREVAQLIIDLKLRAKIWDEHQALLHEVIKAVVPLACQDEDGRHLETFIAMMTKTIRDADKGVRPEMYLEECLEEVSGVLRTVGPEAKEPALQGRIKIVPIDEIEDLKHEELETLRRHYGPHVAMCPELDQ